MTQQDRAATRWNWLQARRRLEQVARAAAVLRRKREALVRELIRAARPAIDSRRRVLECAGEAYQLLGEALELHGEVGTVPSGWPSRDLEVEVSPFLVWGVPAAGLRQSKPASRTMATRGVAPGAAGPTVVKLQEKVENLVDLLLESARHEVLLRSLSAAFSSTSRLVRLLEERLTPELEGRVRQMRLTLDQREREELERLRWLARRR